MDNWHSRFGGREWRVTAAGVQARPVIRLRLLRSFGGRGGNETPTPFRTPGQPLTMRLYMACWREQLIRAAAASEVPLPVLLMVLATENGSCIVERNRPQVHPPRQEPGYISDTETPHRISVGPCHLLISTARLAMDDPSISRAWLMNVGNNLIAAARYIKQQATLTRYDPILVAAAYNAGGLYKAIPGEGKFGNPWHLRSTGTHLDRAARWYGDALAVMAEGAQLAAFLPTRSTP